MRRALVGIPEADLQSLDALSQSQHVSRAELIRQAISIIIWMEVQVGTKSADQAAVDRFLSRFKVLPIDTQVADRAVTLCRGQSIKLPDAIIWATAQVHSRLLVTRNSKDFAALHPGVRNPYVL